MVNIFAKDSLRKTVEAASQGKVTILYDDMGYPNHMAVIPSFTWASVDPSITSSMDPNLGYYAGDTNAVHNAFLVNGVEKSEIFIGMYECSVLGTGSNARPVSLPNMVPYSGYSFNQAKAACLSKRGAQTTGWHMTSVWEQAAILQHTWKFYGEPYGNNYFGAYKDENNNLQEGGQRVDGAIAGDSGVTTNPLTYTGSGPKSWRTNNSYYGISDLMGNGAEYTDLLKLDSTGQICLPDDNYYNLDMSSWTGTGIYFDMDFDGVSTYSNVRLTESSAVTRTTSSTVAAWTDVSSIISGYNTYVTPLYSHNQYPMRTKLIRAGIDPSVLTGGFFDSVNLYRNTYCAGFNPTGKYIISNPNGLEMIFRRMGTFDFNQENGIWSLLAQTPTFVPVSNRPTFRLAFA